VSAIARTATTGYHYTLVTSAAQINADDWNALREHSTNPFMDLRFLQVVESTMGPPAKYWYAIFYDEAQSPVAAACFSLYPVDGAILAPPALQNAMRWGRKLYSRFFMFKVMLCGLPVTTGDNQIMTAPDVDRNALAAGLDEIATRLALEERADFISVKELDEQNAMLLEPLTKHGYRRADSVVTYTLKNEFGSFDDYYATRSKRTRANMRKYMKRFEDAGLRYVHISGADGADRYFTDDVHRLYLDVFQRAEVKFEILPVDFFREFARQLPDISRFTYVFEGDRVVGFVMGICGSDMHYMLLCGVDYVRNPNCDLYFNLLYRGIEYGIRDRAPLIRVGASADEFKRRLGTTGQRLYFYMKSPRAIPNWILGKVFHLVFPPAPPVEAVAEECPQPRDPAADQRASVPAPQESLPARE